MELKELFEDWDTAHWEFSLALEGLSDADLWRRAAPRLARYDNKYSKDL